MSESFDASKMKQFGLFDLDGKTLTLRVAEENGVYILAGFEESTGHLYVIGQYTKQIDRTVN